MRKENNPQIIFNQETNQALARYEELLKHYSIGSKVRDAVWPVILDNLEKKPEKTIDEINSWWHDAFDNNNQSPSGNKNSKELRRQRGLNQLNQAERVIYENQRQDNST